MRWNETEEALLTNRGTMILIFKQKAHTFNVGAQDCQKNRKRSAKGGTMKYFRSKDDS